MAELSKMTLDELVTEETSLRAELASIMAKPFEQRFGRTGDRALTIHYRLNYIEWAKAGKPQPQPRFI